MKVFKHAGFLSLCLLTLLTAGCFNGERELTPEEKAKQIQAGIATANDAMANGDLSDGIAKLEILSQQFPNNPDILESLAFAYAAQPDPILAAFYFEQVTNIAPERTELLPYAAKGYIDAEKWELAAQTYKNYLIKHPMDRSIALELAKLYSRLNRPKDALDTYLHAIESSEEGATAEDATRIGNLFRQIGNPQKAVEYYQMAITINPESTPLAALAGLFELAVNRQDWTATQTLADKIKKQNADALARIPAYTLWLDHLAAQEAQKEKQEAAARAEALAQKQAEEAQKRKQAEEEAAALAQKQAEEEAKRLAEEASKPKPPRQYTVPEILELANDARQQDEFETAINLNWKAINREPENAEAWHQIAHSYLLSGQPAQAEATILEAMRLDPEQLVYRLNYLKIVKLDRMPNRYMAELENAYEQFPEEPEIILMLARAYDKIIKNKRDAHFLYTRFIDIAPDHPERDAVEEAIRQLYN